MAWSKTAKRLTCALAVAVTLAAAGCREHTRLDDVTAGALNDPDKRHPIAFTKRSEVLYVEVAKSAKKLRDAGVKIQVGGHGQLQGLSPNWETWMLTQGGFSNFEALRAATFDGADYLGLGKQIGSLEVGKQADLVVLNSNPLENIRATIDTRYVMVDGRLFDVDSDRVAIATEDDIDLQVRRWLKQAYERDE